jgi:hypothetical protein
MRELPIPVKDVYFGVVEALNDADERPDLFQENFYDLNNVINELRHNRSKYLVLGKKGTGKTTIGKYMSLQSYPNQICKYISYEEFDYRMFGEMRDLHADEYEKYSAAWKWVLLSQIAGVIASDTNVVRTDALVDLQNLMQVLFGNTEAPLKKLVHRKLKRGIQLPLHFVASYFGEEECNSKSHYSISEITELMEALIEEIEYGDTEYIVLLDGLDEKIKKNELYIQAIISLLWEVRRSNVRFTRSGIPIKFVVLLRQDVFDFILEHGPNLNKLGEDNAVILKWTSSVSNKLDWPLAKAMALRINNSIRRAGHDPVPNPLMQLLPDRVHGKEWSRQTWDWICDLTTYKPRDFIAFFNCCKNLCGDTDRNITESVIWSALSDYSEYLVKEFKAELYGHLEPDQTHEIFESIFPKLGKTFLYEDFLRQVRQSEKCNSLDAVKTLALFYKIGLIGNMDKKTGFVQWFYRQKTIVKQDIISGKFQIHAGLWKVLGFW